MNFDIQIEQEIQAKGLTGPRVTPERIEEVISKVNYHVFPHTTVTVCCITLENGFNVIGESACAYIENFDVEHTAHFIQFLYNTNAFEIG